MQDAEILEPSDKPIIDEAYPYFKNGVYQYIDEYLQSDNSIIILQGPPGTGKTRFIRAALARCGEGMEKPTEALYTSDFSVMEDDELFVDFITGRENFLIVEDCDLLLKARDSGNHVMHRFLNVADGILRGLGKKIILSTNLPNISDIDEALLRPGRCFDLARFRKLTNLEASKLVTVLGKDGVEANETLEKSQLSLAEIYREVK